MSEFYRRAREADGLHYNCKQCERRNHFAYRVGRRGVPRTRQIARAREINPDARVDEDITLAKVYRRAGGICCICGREVPVNEASIEHPLALSKGGTHTWDNVDLAHLKCNMKKSDKASVSTRSKAKKGRRGSRQGSSSTKKGKSSKRPRS